MARSEIAFLGGDDEFSIDFQNFKSDPYSNLGKRLRNEPKLNFNILLKHSNIWRCWYHIGKKNQTFSCFLQRLFYFELHTNNLLDAYDFALFGIPCFAKHEIQD